MDLSNMEMNELITYYNELAQKLGREQQHSFKTVGAAKAAITKLEAMMPQEATMSDVQTDPDTQVQNDQAVNATPTPEQLAAASVSPMNSANRRGPVQGIGEFCKALIVEGKTNQEILAAVAVKFNGTAKTSNSCIAFYRNALKGGAASRPRAGKQDIPAMEAKLAEYAKKVEAAKAAAAAKAAQEKLAAEQLAALQAAQAAAQQAQQPSA